MAHGEHDIDVQQVNATERLRLGEKATPLFGIAAVVGALGLVAAIVLGFFVEHGVRRFYHSYLISFAFYLSIAVGALAFVLLQHISRAGWSVSVRRIAETLAGTLPIIGVLSLPILISVLTGQVEQPKLYRWAQPLPEGGVVHHDAEPVEHSAAEATDAQAGTAAEQADHDDHHGSPLALDSLTLAKRPWLNPPFFVLRLVVYFAILSGVAMFYRRSSLQQDDSGDVELTLRMQRRSAPAILISGVIVTLTAFDLLMSLDPHWYSTIFGVYYIAGSFIAGIASIIIIAGLLQQGGWLKQSITREHYHDLGKFLFGFVFFWGYIAYSQYMLLWYANIPETTAWLARRGATTVEADQNAFTCVALLLLIGHLLIPFAGLMSRHVKRRRGLLMFWAVWMLVFHYVDLHWLVMPELSYGLPLHDVQLNFGLIDIACLIGLGGVFVAALVKLAGEHALRPLRDPRLEEAVAFENV